MRISRIRACASVLAPIGWLERWALALAPVTSSLPHSQQVYLILIDGHFFSFLFKVLCDLWVKLQENSLCHLGLVMCKNHLLEKCRNNQLTRKYVLKHHRKLFCWKDWFSVKTISLNINVLAWLWKNVCENIHRDTIIVVPNYK